MSIPRVFVARPCAPGTHVELEREDARHLALVLRMKRGEPIAVVSERIAWLAELTEVKRDTASATILRRVFQASSEFPADVAVLQAVPKGMKMDNIVEKVVELGASRIVPLRCARSYGGDSQRKLDRWRRIARAAAQQSQRLVVPDVEAAMRFEDAIRRFAATSHVVLAHEQAARGSLAAAVQRDKQRPIAIVVGPEGSFTRDELEHAIDAGCDVVSLGSTVLRTDTAAAAMLAGIAALRAWW